MTTLEDLYYGNISPHERYIKQGTRVDKLVKLICKNEEELNSGLTEKQKLMESLYPCLAIMISQNIMVRLLFQNLSWIIIKPLIFPILKSY